MGKAIPDRWVDYQALGRPIRGTRIIPFKVPLQERLCNFVAEGERFSPATLISRVKNLGLIIDLTNTTRYYNSEEFTRKDIKYVKLKCVGQQIPTDSLVKRFCSLITDFLKENASNDLLIGVHCTHGVNRTGYLICRYMIEEIGLSPTQAIEDFNQFRGHCIEREIYVYALYKNNEDGTQETPPPHLLNPRPPSQNSNHESPRLQDTRDSRRDRSPLRRYSSRESWDYSSSYNRRHYESYDYRNDYGHSRWSNGSNSYSNSRWGNNSNANYYNNDYYYERNGRNSHYTSFEDNDSHAGRTRRNDGRRRQPYERERPSHSRRSINYEDY